MMKRIFTVIAVLLFFSIAPSITVAANGPVARMAQILGHLNHYPSASEKKELAILAADSGQTEAIRSLARAMMNMRHSVSPGDKQRLLSLTKDTSQPKPVRQLAGILARLNHQATPQDRQTLKTLGQ